MTEVPASAGDDLLRWVSEEGSGDWGKLRDASAYVCNKHGLQRRPSRMASELSALGHLDVDWERRRWSVAVPSLNLVPGLGLWVVLTGSRPHHIDRRFDEATDDCEVYPVPVAQPPAPAAKLAKCASVEVAARVAERMGAALVVDPARSLLEVMRPVDEVVVEQTPPPRDEVEWFDPNTLRWEPAPPPDRDGLYRMDHHGRPVYRRRDQGYWYEIDLAAGQFLALKERRAAVVGWRPPGREGPPTACFEVRKGVALPTIAERALTVSSGLLPQVVAGWWRYLNVPREVATILTEKLLQPFETRWD
jgi:hypothetical protein